MSDKTRSQLQDEIQKQSKEIQDLIALINRLTAEKMRWEQGINGHSTETGYRVEVRNTHFSAVNPVTLADGIVGQDWREVEFPRGSNPAGVPEKTSRHMVSYEGAVALAWTMLAQNDFALGLECRIVKFKVETKYHVERHGVVEGEIIRHGWTNIKVVPDTSKVSAPISCEYWRSLLGQAA